MLVDYHMHLRAPGSASEELDHTAEGVERYVEQARERGVDEIGITEHVYYFRETRDFWTLPYQLERSRTELGRYCDAVLEAKSRGLPVKLGLEVDWVPERADELAEVLEPYPWDYLIGSVHWIGGLAVDQKPGLWAGELGRGRLGALRARARGCGAERTLRRARAPGPRQDLR